MMKFLSLKNHLSKVKKLRFIKKIMFQLNKIEIQVYNS